MNEKLKYYKVQKGLWLPEMLGGVITFGGGGKSMVPKEEAGVVKELLSLATIMVPEAEIGYSPGLGIRTGNGNSINGEKTIPSIIDKVIRKIKRYKPKDFMVLNLIEDLIRLKITISKHGDTVDLVDVLGDEYQDLKGELIVYDSRNYRCPKFKTNAINGLVGEIQVVTVLQDMADEITHYLYDELKKYTPGTREANEIENCIRTVYELIEPHIDLSENDIRLRSKVFALGEGFPKNDRSRIKEYVDYAGIVYEQDTLLGNEFIRHMYTPLWEGKFREDGEPDVDRGLLGYQAELLWQVTVPSQSEFVDRTAGAFDNFAEAKYSGDEHSLGKYFATPAERYIEAVFTCALIEECATPKDRDYGKKIGSIQNRIIKPLYYAYVAGKTDEQIEQRNPRIDFANHVSTIAREK